MTVERAAEILGGENGHGAEFYSEDFYGEVVEACGYGRDALLKLVKKSPYPDGGYEHLRLCLLRVWGIPFQRGRQTQPLLWKLRAGH